MIVQDRSGISEDVDVEEACALLGARGVALTTRQTKYSRSAASDEAIHSSKQMLARSYGSMSNKEETVEVGERSTVDGRRERKLGKQREGGAGRPLYGWTR